jgi:hypothetical protein
MNDRPLQQEIRRARGRFAAMAATYALGVFNDNFYKQAMMLLAIGVGRKEYQGYAMVVFTAPFILFAAPSGWMADRLPKRTVVIWAKVLELAAMLFGAAGVIFLNWSLAFVMLAIMALQSTIFGPSLNGSIPELYPESYVTKANGVLKVATTAAILGGMSIAGVVLDVGGQGPFGVPAGRFAVGCIVVLVSLAGILASFGVPGRPAAAPGKRLAWAGPVDSIKALGEIARDRQLTLAIWFNAYFWFLGVIELLVINCMGKEQFGFSDAWTSGLVAAQLSGIAAGGLLSARLAARGWYRPVAPAALAMSALMYAVAAVPRLPHGAQSPLLFALIALIGAMGGIAIIPMESFIQVRPAADKKGTVIAAANFAAFSAMLVSGPIANLLNYKVRPTTSFAIMGAATLIVAVMFLLLAGGAQEQ